MDTARTAVDRLGSDAVHAWYAFTDEFADPDRVADCLAMLSGEERARHARFRFARDRHLFVVAHALARSTLSRYADVAPGTWTFVETRRGRPEIAGPPGAPPLRFNLSHTPGLAACAVTLDREVGVDVECVDRRPVDAALPARYFSPIEVEALAGVPPGQWRDAFFAYWTLKESYIKARGLGLAMSLQRFSFRLSDHGAPAIEIAPELDDDPATWLFATHRPGPRHAMAVAVRRSAGETVAVSFRRATEIVPAGGRARAGS